MKNTTLQKGYSLIVIVLITILVTAAMVVGFMYFKQNFNIVKKEKPVSGSANQVIPTVSPTIGLTLTDVDPTAAEQNKKIFGTIEGTFIFPSEGIPNTLKACAENIITTQTFCTPTLKETGKNDSFSLEVPEGSYHVYSTNGPIANSRAYYNEFVTCGLLASCQSREKIIVKVKAGEITKNIKPHDWYDTSQTK